MKVARRFLTRIYSLFILTMWLASCEQDPMGLSGKINKQLDSAIESKVSELRSQYNKDQGFDINEIDKKIKGYWQSISLYNSCTQTCEEADNYFAHWSSKLKKEENPFIRTRNLNSKIHVIVALKQNELKLFDAIQLNEANAGENQIGFPQ